MPSLLALPPLFADEGLNGPDVYSGCAPFRQKTVQNAGRSFWDKYEAASSGSSTGGDSDGATSEPTSPGTGDSPGKKKKEKKEREDGNLKLPDFLIGQDLYALLELDASASQDDIKKSYRKVCLVYHPDKQGTDLTDDQKEAINTKFLQVQEAFDILNDVKKRRKYDSMGEFDDSIPKGLEVGEEKLFFKMFEPAFVRNAKWSEVKPVPALGDAETPYAKVAKFYDFWRSFQSWRDLDQKIIKEAGDDVFHDLNQAECREERRWMERENAKVRSKFQKDEKSRILRLVERAEKSDPRVKAEKDRKWAEVEAKKAEKEAHKRAQEEEKQKKEEARLAKEREAEEALRAEKAQKEEERLAKKAKRTKIRKKIKDLKTNLLDSQLDDYLVGLEIDGLEALSDSLSGAKDMAEALFKAMRDAGFEPIIVKEEIVEVAQAAKKEEPKLSPEEARALEKEKAKKAKEREARMKVEEANAAKLKIEEEAKRAEEKAIKDAKKKVENEKKEKERAKGNKKESEAAKKAEQKKLKEEQAAIEKAAREKEDALKRAEESREKGRLEKEQEDKAKEEEKIWFEFERARREQVEALEKLEWPAVVQAAKDASSNPDVAGALVAAQKREGEDRVDALLACLVPLNSFFALGIRPAETSPTLSSGLRNRIKKLRTKLRNSAGDEFFSVPVPTETTAKVSKANEAALEALLKLAHDPASAVQQEKEKEKENIPNGETPEKTKKSKAKAKAAPGAEEDLDDLLKEFGVDPTAKKSKSKSKKK